MATDRILENIMNRSLPLIIIGLGLSLGVVACGAKKKEAQSEFAKIEADCQSGDKKGALSKALTLRDKNDVFKKAFDEASSGVADKNNVNICGALVRGQISLGLEHL